MNLTLYALTLVFLSMIDIWAMQFMLRQPLVGAPLRLAIDSLFVFIAGLTAVYLGIDIGKATIAITTFAIILYSTTVFDLLTIYEVAIPRRK